MESTIARITKNAQNTAHAPPNILDMSVKISYKIQLGYVRTKFNIKKHLKEFLFARIHSLLRLVLTNLTAELLCSDKVEL